MMYFIQEIKMLIGCLATVRGYNHIPKLKLLIMQELHMEGNKGSTCVAVVLLSAIS